MCYVIRYLVDPWRVFPSGLSFGFNRVVEPNHIAGGWDAGDVACLELLGHLKG